MVGRGVVGVMVEGLMRSGELEEGLKRKGKGKAVIVDEEVVPESDAEPMELDTTTIEVPPPSISPTITTISTSSTSNLASLLAEGIKGSPNLLHSRGVQIYSFLLQELLRLTATLGKAQEQAQKAEALCSTIKFLSTALIHHCAAGSGEGMRGVYDLVAELLEKVGGSLSSSSSSSVNDGDVDVDMDMDEDVGGGFPKVLGKEQSRMVIKIATTILAVRKGQRLPGPATSEGKKNPDAGVLQRYLHILLKLSSKPEIMDDPSLRKEYLKLVNAALIAGKVRDWLSPGMGLIKGVWEGLGLRLGLRIGWVRGLVRLGWKGVEGFLLGLVARYVGWFSFLW